MPSAVTKTPIVLTVNGQRRELEVNPNRRLLDVLREDMDLTGAKRSCDDGECGSCIVLLGNKGVMSCLLPVYRAQGKEITTIEGLAHLCSNEVKIPNGNTERLHPLQKAFFELGASQCGYCIPGFILEAAALLKSNPNPTLEDVKKRLTRNICRCTGYIKIVDAVLYAAELMRGEDRKRQITADDGRLVGESVLRLDTVAEVTGQARYAADLKMEGMLYAKILRSPHHHAKILSVDTSEAQALPGVIAVVTAKDIPGNPAMIGGKPQPFLFPKDKVRFMGEAVAAVAAVSEDIAAEALTQIKVEYEPLPAVLDPLKAGAEDAPLINAPEPNVALAMKVVHGDVERGFAEADVIVENTYTTPRQEHFYMEPEAALAYLDEEDKLILKFPSHVVFEAHDFLTAMLAMDRNRIRIICPPMGGNFGGREDSIHAGVVALLALKTKRPVRVVYSREESLLGSSKWYSFHIRYKTGATRDGKLTAVQAEIIADGGCWRQPPTEKLKNLMIRNTFFATGPYKVPNVLLRAYETCTNSPRAIPLRGIQCTAFALAHETQMDLIAARLGIDPLELRLRNALVVGSQTHTGQVLHESVGIKDALEALKKPYQDALALVKSEQSPSPWRRGVGVGCGWKGIGRASVTKGAVQLLEDGRVRVFSGGVEKGQGLATVFAQIAAEELGIPLESIVMTIGDTELANYPIVTAGQGTTTLAGGAVQDAARRLKEALIKAAADILEESPRNVSFKGGYAFSHFAPQDKLSLRQLAGHLQERGLPTKYEGMFSYQHTKPVDAETGQGAVCDVYGYAAALAQVEVNEETGQVRVPRVVYAADAGRILNPLTFDGQCQGGVVFGLGLALKERYVPGHTRTLKDYNLPTIKDMPDEITVLSVGKPYPLGPFGAKGGGEMSDIPAVPAIMNAIANATEARLFEIPATADKVLEALGRRQGLSGRMAGNVAGVS